jgi:hypothetical protein
VVAPVLKLSDFSFTIWPVKQTGQLNLCMTLSETKVPIAESDDFLSVGQIGKLTSSRHVDGTE